MIVISFPLLGVTIECESFESHRTPARQGGWVTTPADIIMIATFKGRPEIMHRIARSAHTIEEMMVYCIQDAPPVLFGYVIIDKEESLGNDLWRVHMRALRMSYNGSTRPTKQRLCKCGRHIEYWHVNDLMVKAGFSKDSIGGIWDNDLFRFMCCTCFRFKDKPQPQSHGEYITISWISDMRGT